MKPPVLSALSQHDDRDDDEHDLGLLHDLSTMEAVKARVPELGGVMDRRRALATLGGVGAALAVAACTQVTGGGFSVLPTETAGPFPGDGTNGPNALTTSGIGRRDIRSSFGTMSGTATGVPLTVKLRLVDASDGYTPKCGLAVYVWHCNALGEYSLYSSAITNQNYLRGVQVTDRAGLVTFTSIWPGCYPGRWPHIHFEVYSSVASATSGNNKIAVSQLALPEAQSELVYATGGYTGSTASLARISLASDMVFNDGWTHQLATVTGNTTSGMTASLTGAVA